MSEATVGRKARIFRFGYYPQKNWGVTAEEFVAANGSTGRVPIGLDPIGLDHYRGEGSILDGETGHADFSVEGDEVPAAIHAPDWVLRAADKHGLGFSGVFHPTTKKLLKVDLVRRPHVKDAVFLSDALEPGCVVLFADDEPEPEPEAVEFCDESKHEAWQQVHELAADHHESLCDPRVKFSSGHGPHRHVRMLHDLAVHEGAHCPGSSQHHGEVGMSDSDEIIEGGEIEGAEDVEFSEADMTPREKKMYQLMQGLAGKVDVLTGDLVRKDAVLFADEITKGPKARAAPVERQHVIDGYVRAAKVDAKLAEVVTFSEGGKETTGSHLDAFKAAYKARPAMPHRGEKIVGLVELSEEPSEGDKPDEAAAREARRKRNRGYLGSHAAQ